MNNYMSTLMAEDVGAPELRNPNHSAIRSRSLFSRLFGKIRASR